MNRPPDIGDMKNPFTGEVELAEIPQLDLQEFRRFGKILTQPERTINESYGGELRQWNLVDSIQTASNIDRLQEVESALYGSCTYWRYNYFWPNNFIAS